MSKFKPGDRVVVTNISGIYRNGPSDIADFQVMGVGDTGTVVTYEGLSWPVTVMMDSGVAFQYSESELELIDQKSKPGFFVHGARARDLKQVEDFLTGDSHDQSKVQWFDGKTFHNIGYVDDTTRFVK